jgi:hypothetical protein
MILSNPGRVTLGRTPIELLIKASAYISFTNLAATNLLSRPVVMKLVY